MAEDKKEKAAKKPAAKKTVKAETKKAPAKKSTPKAKKEEAVKATPVKKAPAKKAAPKKETVKAKKVEVETVVEEAPKAETQTEVKKKAPAKAAKIVADLDFDWDGFEAGIETYTAEEKAKLSDVYEGTLSQIAEKEVVNGIVIAITTKEIVINIGYKSEGVVPKNEFRYNPDLKIGDPVDLYIETMEDKTGQLVVSHKTARMHRAWQKVNEVLETGEIITGFVKCRTKGGLIADVFGIEAFLPGSQIDVKPIRDYDQYVGKNMEFKVVKINNE